MRRFECEIQVTETWTILVDAESAQEAIEIAEDLEVEEIRIHGEFEEDRVDCLAYPTEVYDD